jgi:uncharacterized OsmC-like protein
MLKKGKTGLLKQTQSNLTSGSVINPITVKVESQNKGPKPSKLLLAALAACQETTWRIYAEDMGIEINQISVKLQGTQDLRGFM